MTRRITVYRVNEKALTRRYQAMEEVDAQHRKVGGHTEKRHSLLCKTWGLYKKSYMWTFPVRCKLNGPFWYPKVGLSSTLIKWVFLVWAFLVWAFLVLGLSDPVPFESDLLMEKNEAKISSICNFTFKTIHWCITTVFYQEISRLKNESVAMEQAVVERLGYLQRYKDMAAFKIAGLQRGLEEAVPAADLEAANRKYHGLTEKYRDLLEKGNNLVLKAEMLTGLEVRTILAA